MIQLLFIYPLPAKQVGPSKILSLVCHMSKLFIPPYMNPAALLCFVKFVYLKLY